MNNNYVDFGKTTCYTYLMVNNETKAVVTFKTPMQAYKVTMLCPFPECMDLPDGDVDLFEFTQVIAVGEQNVKCPNCGAHLFVEFN